MSCTRFLQHRNHGIFPGVPLRKDLPVENCVSEWGRLLIEMEFISHHYYYDQQECRLLVLLPTGGEASPARMQVISQLFPRVTAKLYRYLPLIDEEYNPDKADMASKESLDLSSQYVFPEYSKILLVLPGHLPAEGATTLINKVSPTAALRETFIQDIKAEDTATISYYYTRIALPIFTKTPLTSLLYLYLTKEKDTLSLDIPLLEQELTCHQVLTRNILQQHIAKTWISAYDVKASASIVSHVAKVTGLGNDKQLSQWLAGFMHQFLYFQ